MIETSEQEGMHMGKIICFQKLSDAHIELIGRAAPELELIIAEGSESWQSHLADAEVVIGWHHLAAERCLQEGTKLRWIQNWGAGVNHFPFELLAERGIVLTNTSGVHAFPIAETIFAMMLSFTRKLHTSIRQQIKQEWKPETLDEIHGKTICIVGVGAIGKETAKLAKAFDMTVWGVTYSGKPVPNVDKIVDSSGLEDALSVSDFVVVTLPLTHETRHMIGENEFAAMKPTAMYINIGRGQTTDEKALIAALQNGIIAGAGLDVFEQEPLPADSPLWGMDNVIVSPHHAGATVRYDERAVDIFIRNLHDYSAGREPSLNRVDLSKQY
jgi:phosphoglycerate dehydrogenase-like enzyme